jgi:hypothetical protein
MHCLHRADFKYEYPVSLSNFDSRHDIWSAIDSVRLWGYFDMQIETEVDSLPSILILQAIRRGPCHLSPARSLRRRRKLVLC